MIFFHLVSTIYQPIHENFCLSRVTLPGLALRKLMVPHPSYRCSFRNHSGFMSTFYILIDDYNDLYKWEYMEIHCMISEKWLMIFCTPLRVWIQNLMYLERHAIMPRINKRQGSNATSCTVDQWVFTNRSLGLTSPPRQTLGNDCWKNLHFQQGTRPWQLSPSSINTGNGKNGTKRGEKKTCLLSVLKRFMDIWSSFPQFPTLFGEKRAGNEAHPIPGPRQCSWPCRAWPVRGNKSKGPASYKVWKSQVDLIVQLFP